MSQGQLPFFDESNEPTTKKNAKPDRPKDKRPYTVSGVSRLIKLAISRDLPAKLSVTGEISNCRRPTSGHVYFDMKDETSVLPAVIWRTAVAKLKFAPENGTSVIATGHIDVYEPQGKYQFYIDKLVPAGLGALEMAFRQLAEKLRKEGLFQPEHKKTVPRFPTTIAIVTSPRGAAIEDIEKTLARRYPIVRRLLWPVAVQGDMAAGQIARAIGDINRRSKDLGGIDLIIVGRGGGSLEDLWAFNEEIVARAIFASEIPIISAVGHEIDLTIADIVADMRAATPTAAAELAVPVASELAEELGQWRVRLSNSVCNTAGSSRNNFEALVGRPFFARPLERIYSAQQSLDERVSSLALHLGRLLGGAERAIRQSQSILQRIEPKAALALAGRRLGDLQQKLPFAIGQSIRDRKDHISQNHTSLIAKNPIHRLGRLQEAIDNLTGRIELAQKQSHSRSRRQVDQIARHLGGLNPRAILKRGYSITRTRDANKIVGPGNLPQPGEILSTELDERMFVESTATKIVEKG